MKFLVVLASILVLSNALDKEFKEKFTQKMHEYGTKCFAEVHATDGDLAELIAHKIPPTSHEAKCMIYCLHKSFNMVAEDGVPNKEGTLEMLAPLKETDTDMYDKMVKVFETCTASFEKNDDPCISSTKWAECGIREGKALGMSEDLFDM